MKIQICSTGQILDLDNAQSIPSGERFIVLNPSGTSAFIADRKFRVDSSNTVSEVFDDTEQAILDSRQARMNRICSNDKSKRIDLSKLNTDTLDGYIEGSAELRRQRISNNYKSR